MAGLAALVGILVEQPASTGHKTEKVAPKAQVAQVAMESMAEVQEQLEPWELGALAPPLTLGVLPAAAVATMAAEVAGLITIHLLLSLGVVAAAGRGTSFPRPPMFPPHSVGARATGRSSSATRSICI